MNCLSHNAISRFFKFLQSVCELLLGAEQLFCGGASIPLPATGIARRIRIVIRDFAYRFPAHNSIQRGGQPKAAMARQRRKSNEFVLRPFRKRLHTVPKNLEARMGAVDLCNLAEPLNANAKLGLDQRDSVDHSSSGNLGCDHVLLGPLTPLIGGYPDGSNHRPVGCDGSHPCGCLRRYDALQDDCVSSTKAKQYSECAPKGKHDRIFADHSFHGAILA